MSKNKIVKDDGLSAKDYAFIDAYFKWYSIAKAYKAVYPQASQKTAERHGLRLSKRPCVKKEILKRKNENRKKNEVCLQKLIEANMNIIETNIIDFYEPDEDGNLQFNPNLLTRNSAFAIQALDVSTEEVIDYKKPYKNGKPQTKIVQKTKIKFYDKTKAIKFISEMCGYILPDKSRHDVTLEDVLEKVAKLPSKKNEKVIDITVDNIKSDDK